MSRGDSEETRVEQKIKNIFQENMNEITMDSSFREKLISLKKELKPVSAIHRFLEYEICLPVYTVSAAAGVVVIIAGVFINTLLLPGQIEQPKYQIIEIRASQVQYTQSDY